MFRKNKKLLGLILFSIVIEVYLFWTTYIFNPKFYSNKGISYIADYIEANGHIHLIALFLMILLYAILFIIYAIYEHKRMLVFEHNDGQVEFYKQDNGFSFGRFIQYISLIIGLYTTIKLVIRTYTLGLDHFAYYIFKTDIFFTMLDMVFIFYTISTLLLTVEYFSNVKTTYH